MRINRRLPGCLAAGFVFGPEFKTNIVTGPNGAEWRNRDWRYGRWRATGNYHAFGPGEQEQMDAAFQVAAGMWAAFRVRDESAETVGTWKVSRCRLTSGQMSRFR